MKYILFLFIWLFFSSCETKKNHYGEIITSENIVDYSEAKKLVAEQGKISTKIQGTILETCAKKGCWIRLKADNDTLFVRFKDYGFFVPTSGVEGKTAVLQGEATYETLEVDEVRHYAEDAGKSKEEIELITDPEYIFSFTATGVIIEN